MRRRIVVRRTRAAGDSATILALGKHGAPDARAQLRAIADEELESEGREMARLMLDSWVTKDNTYRSIHPQRVDRFTVPVEEMQKVLPKTITPSRIVFEVSVDESGCTAEVEVMRPGLYPDLNDLVLRKVKNLRYVPKKVGTEYAPERFELTFRPEIR